MLTGTSPFKDASEWLIFQRIMARDVKFPDYFSQEARDLIDKLLVSYFKRSQSLPLFNDDKKKEKSIKDGSQMPS